VEGRKNEKQEEPLGMVLSDPARAGATLFADSTIADPIGIGTIVNND
jgi:hypothetical protein